MLAVEQALAVLVIATCIADVNQATISNLFLSCYTSSGENTSNLIVPALKKREDVSSNSHHMVKWLMKAQTACTPCA